MSKLSTPIIGIQEFEEDNYDKLRYNEKEEIMIGINFTKFVEFHETDLEFAETLDYLK